MAIWPFGRRNKRHTIAETPVPVPAPVAGSRPLVDAPLGRKPSRKQSKRRKERHSQPPEDIGGYAFHDSVGRPATSSRPSQAYPHHGAPSSSQQASRYPPPLYTGPFDAPRAFPNAASEQHAPAVSRTGSLLRRKPSDSGGTLLRRKSSKRKANDIAREREIRLMSSSPIDVPRNRFRPATGEQFSAEPARGPPHAVSRQSDRHWSGLSMSIRNSAASSMTDVSDSYTFKVNALAAWTPRPVLRYVGTPRPPTWTSRNESAASDRRDRWPVVPSISEDDLSSKKRVEELADDLDAGALRELLDRDRRRKERKRVEDQEQLQRKLQRRAERQRKESRELQPRGVDHNEERRVDETGGGHAIVEGRDDSLLASDEPQTTDHLTESRNPPPRGAPGSWLRDPSKERERERERNHRESLDSVRVIGNIDDSSIRAAKRVTQRSSLALSQDTISSTRSPVPPGFGSPNSSQIYHGLTRDSTSDVSRTVDSERRQSDHSSRRTGTLSSFFRRGSSRLKRSYRERFQADQGSDRSNTSHESFFKVQTTHAPGLAAPYAGSKTFLRPGTTIQRPQSKFKEHFGDEAPISPPASRHQSPEIPETIPDQITPTHRYDGDHDHGRGCFPTDDDVTVSDAATQHHDTCQPDGRHRSWGSDSYEGSGGPDPLPLSQSLASVDSEGSWMSGKFLRRISQGTRAPTHHLHPRLRHSIGSIGDRLEEEQEYSRDIEDVAADDYFARFTPSREDEDVDAAESHAGTRRPSSTAIGELIGNGNGLDEAPEVPDPPTETAMASAFEAATRHGAVGKRPTVVTPGDHDRRQSNVAQLNHVDLVSPVSVSTMQGDSTHSSPIDDEPAAVGRARSVDFGRGGGHARQISAGSARLLDIHRRSSTSKPEPEDDHYVAPGTAF